MRLLTLFLDFISFYLVGKLDFETADDETAKKIRFGHVDWRIHFAALLHYRSKHGHCNIPQKEDYECNLEGVSESKGDVHFYGKLGRWLDNQRQFKKVGKLREDREMLLQGLVDEGALYWDASQLGVNGLTNAHGVDWQRHYFALLEFIKLKGHANVPQKASFECDVPGKDGRIERYNEKLGRWLDNQRQFKKGNGGKLSKERESLLQQLVDDGTPANSYICATICMLCVSSYASFYLLA